VQITDKQTRILPIKPLTLLLVRQEVGTIYSHLTLSMIDKFCVPVLLYGLEALDNKSSSIKAIDFVYNSVFVKKFNLLMHFPVLTLPLVYADPCIDKSLHIH